MVKKRRDVFGLYCAKPTTMLSQVHSFSGTLSSSHSRMNPQGGRWSWSWWDWKGGPPTKLAENVKRGDWSDGKKDSGWGAGGAGYFSVYRRSTQQNRCPAVCVIYRDQGGQPTTDSWCCYSSSRHVLYVLCQKEHTFAFELWVPQRWSADAVFA